MDGSEDKKISELAALVRKLDLGEDGDKFLNYVTSKNLTKENFRSLEKDGELNDMVKEDAGIADRIQRNKLVTALRDWIQVPADAAPAKKTTVCVTGVTGFVAGHVVEQLLTKGYKVHGTVRSKDPKKVAHVLNIQKKTGGELVLFEAELLKDTSFADAFQGCDYVIHTASPYTVTVKDPMNDLVKPAVGGTMNVLRSAAHVPSIKRVILTSSMAAITDSPSGELTEEVWNTKSSETRNPYYFSKTQAELAAWKFMKEKFPKYDLVTINPFMIIGPSHSSSLNESPKILSDLITGQYPAVMDLTWGFVDVRDVARAHVLAMENPKAHGRYICVDHQMAMSDLCAFLSTNFPQLSRKIPKTNMECGPGTSLLKVLANFQPSGVKDYLQTHLGKELKINNAKIKAELNFTFTDLKTTLKDTVQDLITNGHVVVPSDDANKKKD